MKSLIVFLCVLTVSCTSAVMVGKAKPPLNPEQVKMYLTPPKKYEEIALLEGDSYNSMSLSSQGKMNSVIKEFKKRAAKMGANGVILRETGSKYAGSTKQGAPITLATANGIAIFVIEE